MKKIYGVIYTMISAAAYGLQPVLAKIAYNNGANTTTVLILRYVLGSIMLFTYIHHKNIDFKIDRKQMHYISFLGIIGYAMTAFLLFLSYNYISVGLATVIHFVYPVCVTILALIFYKEKLNFNKGFALVLSVLGIYLLVGNGELHLSIKGVILSLVSGVFYAVYIVGVDNRLVKNINNYVLTFYLTLVSAISLILLGVTTKSIAVDLNMTAITACIGIAFFSGIVAAMLLLEGIRIIGPSNAAILSTFEPIVGTFLGIIVLNESFTFQIAIGSILILASVVIVTIANKKEVEENI